MKLYILEKMFEWLAKNTLNFSVRNWNMDILKVYKLIQRQLSNVESGFITKKQLPIAIWFHIFNEHILINGNKRLAFVLYHYMKEYHSSGTCQELKYYLNSLKGELEYLEDK